MNSSGFLCQPRLPSGALSNAAAARFAAEGTNAYRLFSTPEGWVERLGDDLLVSHRSEAAREELVSGARVWAADYQWEPRRIFGKLLPRQNADRVTPVLLAGDPAAPLPTVVQEAGIRFGLDFAAGYSAGLFLDQRANRAYLRTRTPRRLLNTFAYTCSFSVVAALAGAETVSIDLSKKSLDRGRANFALNNVETARTDGWHRFLADDVLEVLPRLERRGERFDFLILDPPTFSRGRGGARFQVERDFEALLTAALAVAAPGAAVLLSTNCTRLSRHSLEGAARHSLKMHRRAGTFHVEPELPDIPAEMAATTVWLRLK